MAEWPTLACVRRTVRSHRLGRPLVLDAGPKSGTALALAEAGSLTAITWDEDSCGIALVPEEPFGVWGIGEQRWVGGRLPREAASAQCRGAVAAVGDESSPVWLLALPATERVSPIEVEFRDAAGRPVRTARVDPSPGAPASGRAARRIGWRGRFRAR